MKSSSALLSQALILYTLIPSSTAAVISPASQLFQSQSNLSLPDHASNDDVRFELRGHYGDENLNIIALLMNTINGLANLAHQPCYKRIPGFHVEILPWYADIDISIQPARPARDIEVQIAVNALYYAVYNMIANKVFKNAEFDIFWDGNIVGQILIEKATGPSRTVSEVFNASQTTTEPSTPLSNQTVATNLTANSGEGLRLFFHYRPHGEKMSFQEVFVTLMAALKNLSRWPSSQVVEPFRTGARGCNARMQFYGDETPRTEPPFLTYALLVDSVRQFPFYMVDHKRFAELQAVVVCDGEVVGEVFLERGSPELGGVGGCGGGSSCDLSSS